MGSVLSSAEIDSFMTDGFIKLPGAFGRDLADEGRALLWRELGLSPDEPESWTQAKIWLTSYDADCFLAAARSPRVTGAFDDLAGAGRWQPVTRMGSFPIRFPNRPETEPDDKDWHIEASWGDPGRTNVFSRAHLLLVLFLFSDLEGEGGATRTKVGSHLEMARRLEPYGADGVAWPHQIELSAGVGGQEVLATGEAGDIYLCHRFLVHAAAPNLGRRVRFMAQQAIAAKEEVCLERSDPSTYSAVERSIRLGLGWDHWSCGRRGPI
jgi:hypothetical protein